MSKPVARLGDSVPYVCIRGDDIISGIGSIVTASSNVNSDGAPIARDGDQADCGLCGIGTIRATSQHNVNGKPIATLGDQVEISGGYAYISSASNKQSTK